MPHRFFRLIHRDGALPLFDALLAQWRGQPLGSLKDLDGLTLAMSAAQFNRADVLHWLADKGVDLGESDADGATPLHHAADFCSPEAMSALIERGADVNAIQRDGATAAHLSANRGDAAAIKRLALAGAKLSVQDTDGNTPAHVAAYVGDERVIDALHKANAVLNARNQWGQSPAYLAAHEGNVDAFARLAKAGVDLVAPDNDGRTAVHVAAMQGKPKVLAVVKAEGEPLTRPDRQGAAAAHWAAAQNRKQVLHFLVEQGLPLPRRPAEWPAEWEASAVSVYQQRVEQVAMRCALADMASLEPEGKDKSAVQNRLADLVCPISFEPYSREGPRRPVRLPDVDGVPGSVISAYSLGRMLEAEPPHADDGALPLRDPCTNSLLDRDVCRRMLDTGAVDRERQTRVDAVLGVYLGGGAVRTRAAHAFAAAAPVAAPGPSLHFQDVLWPREPRRGGAAAAATAALPRGSSAGAGPAG